MGREFLPLFGQGVQELLYVLGQAASAQFIGLGEDDAKGNGVLTQPFNELQVYLLGLVAAVYEDKERCQLGALQDVVVDYAGELVLLALAALGIAVAGQIHKIPVLVDKKVVDEQCLTGCGRCHGQALAVSQHVDEAGFTHVGTAYECVLGHAVLRAFAYVRVADYEFGALNLHFVWVLCVQKYEFLAESVKFAVY